MARLFQCDLCKAIERKVSGKDEAHKPTLINFHNANISVLVVDPSTGKESGGGLSKIEVCEVCLGAFNNLIRERKAAIHAPTCEHNVPTHESCSDCCVKYNCQVYSSDNTGRRCKLPAGHTEKHLFE